MAHSLAAVASVSPSAVRRRRSSQVTNVISSLSSVSFRSQMSFMSIRSRPSPLRSTICCSAKEETVQAKTVQAKKETVDKAKEETVQAKKETVDKAMEETVPAKTVQAKKETVDKVCDIVKRQLALSDGTAVTAESKFSELGADSLDTVEIVMGLEEEFNITVDETSAQDIATVQDAADVIEKLLLEKTA